MFENINYKNKKQIIIILLILLFFVGYRKVFKSTIQKKQIYNTLLVKKKDSTFLKEEIARLKNKITFIDDILFVDNKNKLDIIQEKILNFTLLNSDSLSISIESIESQLITKVNNVSIISNTLILKGKYNDILKTIFNFEENFKLSKVKSVYLYKEKNYKTKKTKLYAKLLFQNFSEL